MRPGSKFLMNQKPLKINLKNAAEHISWKFWLWLSMFFLVVIIMTIITTAWAVRNVLLAPTKRFTESQSQIILSLASFPATLKSVFIELEQIVSGVPLSILVNRKDAETLSWIRHFPAIEDNGYLLFSGTDTKAKQSVVKLIRISDGLEMARWEPDFF